MVPGDSALQERPVRRSRRSPRAGIGNWWRSVDPPRQRASASARRRGTTATHASPAYAPSLAIALVCDQHRLGRRGRPGHRPAVLDAAAALGWPAGQGRTGEPALPAFARRGSPGQTRPLPDPAGPRNLALDTGIRRRHQPRPRHPLTLWAPAQSTPRKE